MFGLASLLNTTDAVVRSLSVPLLLREISEDLSLVSRMLVPVNQTTTTTAQQTAKQREIPEQLLSNNNSSASNSSSTDTSTAPAGLDQLHLTNRLRVATEELRRFRLLGLPSLGDILDSSANLTQATLNRTLERLRLPEARQSLTDLEDGNTTSTAALVIEDDEEYYYDDDEEGKQLSHCIKKLRFRIIMLQNHVSSSYTAKKKLEKFL